MNEATDIQSAVAGQQPRICGCGKILHKSNVSGLCRVCVLAAYQSDPETRLKRAAGIRRWVASPEGQEKKSRIGKEVSARPSVKETHRRNGLLYGVRNILAPEAAKKGGRTRSMIALGWLPQDREQEYKTLRRDFGAEAARRMIEEDMARDPYRSVMSVRSAMLEKQARERASAY